MKIIKFIVISLALAFLVTVVSLVIGELMAPGVYYTIEGGFLGVELEPKIKIYVLQVFISYFICSYMACYLSNIWVGRNST